MALSMPLAKVTHRRHRPFALGFSLPLIYRYMLHGPHTAIQ